MTPTCRLLDPGFVYHNAASHSDQHSFQARMLAYAERVARERTEQDWIAARERARRAAEERQGEGA